MIVGMVGSGWDLYAQRRQAMANGRKIAGVTTETRLMSWLVVIQYSLCENLEHSFLHKAFEVRTPLSPRFFFFHHLLESRSVQALQLHRGSCVVCTYSATDYR